MEKHDKITELKAKVMEYVGILEADKESITTEFLSWMKLINIQPSEMKIEYINKIFDKVIERLEKLEPLLVNDLEDNYEAFCEFFLNGVKGGTDCFNEMHDLIEMMKNIWNESDELKEEEGEAKERLFELADTLHFLKFQKEVFNFYKHMSTVYDDVFAYADTLYIKHTGDVTLCGTRTS